MQWSLQETLLRRKLVVGSAKLAVSAVVFCCLKQYNKAYEATSLEELRDF
jgi:hypothetical protein